MARRMLGRFFSSRGGVYHHIRRIERNEQVFRADNRSPERLVIDRGLPLRVKPERVRELTRDCIDNYQNFNLNPFGYGACLTFEKLYKNFILPNATHLSQAHIYNFVAKGFSISEYRLEVGESGDRDYEDEFLVYKVDSEDILVAVPPDYREKFLSNALVPNEAILLNPKLPKKVRLSDLESPAATLQWLLKEGATKSASRYAKHMFSGKSEHYLERALADTDLMGFVTKMVKLKPNDDDENTSELDPSSPMHKI